MTSQDWLLIVSLILNGALVVTLFFRSALNEILSHWFKTRFINREERQRELLLELHWRMNSYDRDYFTVMALIASGMRREEESDLWKTAKPSVMATNDFMERHGLELPPSIRDLLKELTRAIQWRDFDVDLPKRPGPNDVLKMGRAVSDATKNVRTEIERLIG